MADKIATELEASQVGGALVVLEEPNKCCTKARADILGCNVLAGYQSNQLVPRNALSKKIQNSEFYLGIVPSDSTRIAVYCTKTPGTNVTVRISLAQRSTPGQYLTTTVIMTAQSTVVSTNYKVADYNIATSRIDSLSPTSYNGVNFVIRGSGTSVTP